MRIFGKPLRLVISDVDGVILHLVGFLKNNLARTALELGFSIEPIEDYFRDVKAGSRRGHANLGQGLAEFWPELSLEKSQKFTQRFRDIEKESPYPAIDGSVQTITWLHREGIAVALCTSNDMLTLSYRMYSIGLDMSLFRVLSTADSIYSKPHPKTLDLVFEKVSIPREHAVYVGDWYPDLAVARAGQVRFLAVLSGGIPRGAFLREGVPSDHILETFSNIRSLITPD